MSSESARMSALSQLPKIDIGMVLGSERLPPPRGPVRLDLGGIDTSEAPAVRIVTSERAPLARTVSTTLVMEQT